MSLALPRTRSFHRPRPLRLWWLAVGLALLANLAVIVGLSQVSRIEHAAVEPPLVVRTLRRLPDEPLPPPEPPLQTPRQTMPQAVALVALPSLDLPSAGPVGELELPAVGSLAVDLELPLTIPAFASLGDAGDQSQLAPASVGALTWDTPAEREGGFDLDRFYPRSARLRGTTGSTTVRLGVDADGTMTTVEVLASDPPGVFEQAAGRLARSLRYRPAQQGGRPVASVLVTTIAWTMR